MRKITDEIYENDNKAIFLKTWNVYLSTSSIKTVFYHQYEQNVYLQHIYTISGKKITSKSYKNDNNINYSAIKESSLIELI